MITLKKKDGAYTIGVNGTEHRFETLTDAMNFLKKHYKEKQK